MRTTVKDRQTLADIGLQEGGSMAEAMETAIRNGLSLTARLEDGQELETPDQPEGTEGQNVTRYRLEGVEPATEPTDEERVLCPYGGIGFMKIEIDFIVS